MWKPQHGVRGASATPDHESFHTSTNPTRRGRKRWSPVSVAPRTVWKPQFVGQRHPGRTRCNPRIINHSIHLQLQHTGDEHCPPGQSIPPRTVWKPQPGVRRASAQRHPGGIWSHPRSEILTYIYNSNKPGTRTVVLRVDTTPHGVEILTPLAYC